MKTELLKPTDANIMRCAARLRMGGLVAFPTETVYALGAAATDAAAVKRLFDVKERPADRPLIVAVARKSDISKVAAAIPPKAAVLIDKFMPGALTLVLERAPAVPDIVTAGGASVAVRIPDDPVCKKLIELARVPVVVPSANTSGKPSPTSAAHVLDDLNGKIEYILDGGESDIGIESTIVDVRAEPPVILRVGGVAPEDIERAIGPVEIRSARQSSGSHYSPRATVMFSAFYTGMTDNICAKFDALTADGRKPVILCLDANKPAYGARNAFTLGADYKSYAHNLFGALRKADAENYDTVIAEGVQSGGIGSSLIERLIKISEGNVI